MAGEVGLHGPRVKLDEPALGAPIRDDRNLRVAICFDAGLPPAWLWIAGGPNGLQDYGITVCVIRNVSAIHELAALWTRRVKVTHEMDPRLWLHDSTVGATQERVRICVAGMAVDVRIALRVRRHHCGSTVQFCDERIIEKGKRRAKLIEKEVRRSQVQNAIGAGEWRVWRRGQPRSRRA
jgi:hypothetical protein